MPERDTVNSISKNSPAYPARLRVGLLHEPPKTIWVIGNADLLKTDLVAVFCSIRCPGDEILKLYDVARGLRNAGIGVVSGFHTPMERECLITLLRGQQPIVICPARSLHRMRIPPEWRESLAGGRLAVVSSFHANVSRATQETASTRNRFVVALAKEVLIAYAEAGGQTAKLADDLTKAGCPPWTLASPEVARFANG